MASVSNGSVLKEFWLSDIQEIIPLSNKFMESLVSDDGYIAQDIYQINIPQGQYDSGTIIEGLTAGQLPLAASVMTDQILNYNVGVVTFMPRIVSNALIADALISYDKRAHVLKAQSIRLLNRCGNKVLNGIAQSLVSHNTSNIFYTTGSAVTAAAPGTTGTRLATLVTDFLKVIQAAKYDGFDAKELVAICPPQMASDLLTSTVLYLNGNNSLFTPSTNAERASTGVLGQIYGVTIMERGQGLMMSGTTVFTGDTSAGVGGPSGATYTAGANETMLIVNTGGARKAMGNFDLFVSENRAEYLGTLINMSAYILQQGFNT
jgi:hypothetical protein